MNFNFLVSVAVLLNYIFDANFFDFQQFDYLLRCMDCKVVTGKIFLQFELGFGNVRHFLSLDFFSVFDDFVDFQKVFLSMGTNLGSCSGSDLILDLFPVFSVAHNG